MRLAGFAFILMLAMHQFSFASATPYAASDLQNPLVKEIDLSTSFHTSGTWHLLITQGDSLADKHWGITGAHFYAFCFEKNPSSHLNVSCWPKPPLMGDNKILNFTIAPPAGSAKKAVIMVQTNQSGYDNPFPGGDVTTTMIWTYDRSADQFVLAFLAGTNPNNNEQVRLVSSGPLAGDVIVAQQGHRGARILLSRSPYSYGIRVYRLRGNQYIQVLYFAGETTYGDGDPRPVIDSDMPDILRLMH